MKIKPPFFQAAVFAFVGSAAGIAVLQESADFVGVGVPDDPKNNTSSVICFANATFPKGKALKARRVVAPYEGMETKRGEICVAPNRRQKAAAS